jgi:hypothetical protein
MGIESAVILVVITLFILFGMGGNEAREMRNTAIHQKPQQVWESDEAYNKRIDAGQRMQWWPALAFGGCVVPFGLCLFGFFIMIWIGEL